MNPWTPAPRTPAGRADPAVRRRLRISAVAALAAGLLGAAHLAGAAPAAAAGWQLEPAGAPPPPAGTAPAPYSVPVGGVGQISFWAPNRGLLIAGGTQSAGGVVPSGLYAYDGTGWHLLSTVCGGADGRIAWAGPDEFWTISDQRPGQVTSAGQSQGTLQSISLCHFANGQVVGSYAMPVGQSDSYVRMDAAACASPSNCWFGGQNTSGPTPGAFHLHWDGSAVNVVQAPEDHAVDDMIEFQGQLYESVRITAGDTYQQGEDPAHPAVLHTIGTGATGPFTDTYTFGQGQVLPAYGQGVSPSALEGFSLGTGGGAQGAGASQLWALANPASRKPQGSQPASLTVLRRSASGWSQVLPAAGSGSGSGSGTCQPIPAGDTVSESSLPGTPSGRIAPLPGTSSAWLSLSDGNTYATVALLNSSGCVTEVDQLPSSQSASANPMGGTGPIACPAANDCWMATTEGWLYHYTDGTSYARDTDPNFAGVITYRPSDGATPPVYADVPPPDDSILPGNPNLLAATTPGTTFGPGQPARRPPLYSHVHGRLVDRTTLVLSFQLNASTRMQLRAFRGHRLVARSREELLRPGRRSLSVHLNPHRWPDRLSLKTWPVATGPTPAH